MVIVNAVNVVLEERTAPSHVLMHTRQYKAGKEPSIAMGMTLIRLLVIYIERVTKWHHSSGTWHSVRWHQPMVTALVREVLGWLKVGAVATAVAFVYTYVTVNRNRCH